MNGRYRIEIDSEERADPWHTTARSRWHALIATCKSLAADGLKYKTELAPVAGSERAYTVTVTAWGQPVKRKAQRARLIPKIAIPNAPLTLEQCTRGRHKAEESVESARHNVRDHVARFTESYDYYFGDLHYGSWWRVYDHAERERQQRFGRGLARIIAMRKGQPDRFHPIKPEVYAELDKIAGRRVVRLSELKAHEDDYYKAIVERYANGHYGQKPSEYHHAETNSTALLAELENAKADVEFWRELELLSGQRERFKPGRETGVDKSDDEVRTRNVYVYV